MTWFRHLQPQAAIFLSQKKVKKPTVVLLLQLQVPSPLSPISYFYAKFLFTLVGYNRLWDWLFFCFLFRSSWFVGDDVINWPFLSFCSEISSSSFIIADSVWLVWFHLKRPNNIPLTRATNYRCVFLLVYFSTVYFQLLLNFLVLGSMAFPREESNLLVTGKIKKWSWTFFLADLVVLC